MSRWQYPFLVLLCVVAIGLGVMYALEHSRATEAEGRALASAQQVDRLSAKLEDLHKELRWALAVANARLAELGGEQVTTPGAAPTTSPTTTPTTAGSQPSPRACLLAPLNPLC